MIQSESNTVKKLFSNCDCFYFTQNVLRKLFNSNAGTSRFACEVFFINCVECCEISHISKETCCLYNVVKCKAGFFNRPGVTKGKQWIRLNKNVELLDTPGILWPKFEDQEVGIRLAFVGSIKDDILNMEELALQLIDYLKERYTGLLEKRYGISEEENAVEILGEIAKARGCLKKGEELDYTKASGLLFDDFRSGKIGRITLEWAEQEKN